MRILGISAFYHDSAAALLVDGEIVAAAQEERFSRVKHDADYPARAVEYVLREGGLDFGDLTAIAFYDKPFLKFERLLETYHAFVPAGLPSFIKAMPVWIKDKLFIRKELKKQWKGAEGIPLFFPEHHLSHAASAFYPSPYEEAAILTIDGVGEWATTTICQGRGQEIEILSEGRFPHSIGLLYAAFTYYLGFEVNNGEYKVMGLAPYGSLSEAYINRTLETLIDVRSDGSTLLNMEYFDFASGLTMTKDRKWAALFGFPRRMPGAPIEQHHCDLARAIQEVTNRIVVALADTAARLTGSRNLVMAGGVALNCVSNSRVAASGVFDNIWIQPAAGDAGGALGAAYAAYHIGMGAPRRSQNRLEGFPPNRSEGASPVDATAASPVDVPSDPLCDAPSAVFCDAMQGAYLGPSYADTDIRPLTRLHTGPVTHFPDFNDLSAQVAQLLAEGLVVGWFQGRMEFGPRALGNRSILGDPRNPDMQRIINQKIKFREGFRPFAPAVLEEDQHLFFETPFSSPYMLFVEPIRESLRRPEPDGYDHMGLYDRLYHVRSEVPAVTHIDYTARLQTVHRQTNPRFWQLLRDFKKITRFGMLINTSFNVRDEPIVCTPHDAYQGFMRTEMDALVLGDFLMLKR